MANDDQVLYYDLCGYFGNAPVETWFSDRTDVMDEARRKRNLEYAIESRKRTRVRFETLENRLKGLEQEVRAALLSKYPDMHEEQFELLFGQVRRTHTIGLNRVTVKDRMDMVKRVDDALKVSAGMNELEMEFVKTEIRKARQRDAAMNYRTKMKQYETDLEHRVNVLQVLVDVYKHK